MNCPTTYSPDALATSHPVLVGLADGRWVRARPLGWHGLRLRYRIRCAWLVFAGRADVLIWEGPQ